MSENLFPSGRWAGFYNYSPGDKHRMELALTFSAGKLYGDGIDDIGKFSISGGYETTTLECWWAKTYLGAHTVWYRGFREGKGIWGTWQLSSTTHGGFHIWPCGAEEGDAITAVSKQSQPVADPTSISVSGRVAFAPPSGTLRW